VHEFVKIEKGVQEAIDYMQSNLSSFDSFIQTKKQNMSAAKDDLVIQFLKDD
jgi:hypothetical protein